MKTEAFKKDDMLDDIMGELGGSDDVIEEPKTFYNHRKPVVRKPIQSTSQWRKPQSTLKKRMSSSSQNISRPQPSPQPKPQPSKPQTSAAVKPPPTPPPVNREPLNQPMEIKVGIKNRFRYIHIN